MRNRFFRCRNLRSGTGETKAREKQKKMHKQATAEKRMLEEYIFAEETKTFREMEENEKKELQTPETMPPQEEAPATPNRDAYKAAFGEDYPDVDFENKEERYGKMVEDRKKLKSYRESGQRLNDTFSKNRWLAAMMQDITENDDPDYSPIDWMADHGIDINEAMSDEATRKKVSDKIAEFQKKQAESEAEDEERQKNFAKSAEVLKKLGLSEEESNQMWLDFFNNIIDPGLRGEVTEETWRMIQKGTNYDNDIEEAKQTSAMKARNEKMANKVKTFDEPMPPSLSQGGAGQQVRKKPKKESFFDGLKEAGY